MLDLERAIECSRNLLFGPPFFADTNFILIIGVAYYLFVSELTVRVAKPIKLFKCSRLFDPLIKLLLKRSRHAVWCKHSCKPVSSPLFLRISQVPLDFYRNRPSREFSRSFSVKSPHLVTPSNPLASPLLRLLPPFDPFWFWFNPHIQSLCQNMLVKHT